MSPKESQLLNEVLENTQLQHQPFVVIRDQSWFPARPILRELVRRAVARGETLTLVSALNSIEDLVPCGMPVGRIKTLDLSGEVAGYSALGPFSETKERIVSSYKGGQMFIDAIDVLAEDYTASSVMCLVRELLTSVKAHKAPSRLVLLLSEGSLLSHLISPTFSTTLTLLTPHSSALLTHLSKLYLSPISENPSPNYWMVLENAVKRQTGKELALRGEEDVEFGWVKGEEVVIQVLVRKATGGIKGTSRSLEALTPTSLPGALVVCPLSSILDLTPFSLPQSSSVLGTTEPTHASLDLPFNLALTDKQKQKRDQVPLPYAHEGEGASGDLIWIDEEETDDEEI
ncbi:hypothetical protein L204_103579 [Cryptococcus depauperatus]|nr:hypothetical protein L204_01893 [Cryptococcus depauperatus CBS 7855]